MRDTLDLSRFDPYEETPLIPDPPIKRLRVKQRSNCCHQCWSRFTCCSKWTIVFIIILIIILVLIIVRSVLPFGWPWWPIGITYDASDPHIIVIVADDIGWGDLGYGGAEFPTNNIDQLKQQGIALNKMYAHQSGSATRAALLTGIPGYELGLQNGIDTGSNAHIPLDIRLLPEILKSERGYTTHAIGKWSLGYSKWDYTPTKRGFDTFLGFHQRYIDYWHYSATIEANKNALKVNSQSNEMNINKNNEMLIGYDLWKNDRVYTPPTKMQYVTELFDSEILNIIDEHSSSDYPDQPMFLYYTPPNAHAPIEYHYEYDNECSYIRETSELIRYKYCNLIQELDSSIGLLVNKLKQNNMWDRTIILFTSDNGGLMCWDVGSVNTCSGSVNLPLRGGKGTLFEGSLRVRTILSGGYIDESLYGTSNDQLMHSTDLFSTLLNAANVGNDIIYNIYSNDASISNNIGNKKQVKGLPFWDYITRKNTEAPIRGDPFIADINLDSTLTYIEQAALYWKGYKYIIQPLELYDGWWQSPLQGPMEMPSDAAGVQTEPQPLPRRKQNPNPKPDTISDIPETNDDLNDISGWSTFRVNEYLFKIDDDPNETKNIRMSPENEQILQDLRRFLEALAGEPGTYIPQDSGTCVDANPNLFGNVWYPFEEEYRQ